jgi:RNA polymerase sigma-70 factor, ECF subfamily
MDFFAFDDDYVRRLREGDRVTEEHFTEYFGQLLKLKLRRRLRSSSDIDDVIQEVYLRVLKGLREGDGVRDGRKLGAYVLGVCNHVVQEFERKRHDHSDINDEPIPSPQDDPFEDFRTKRNKELAIEMLAWLKRENKRDAGIMLDLFIKELDKEKVCRDWGITRDYLRVVVHRALKKFREKYDDPDES